MDRKHLLQVCILHVHSLQMWVLAYHYRIIWVFNGQQFGTVNSRHAQWNGILFFRVARLDVEDLASFCNHSHDGLNTACVRACVLVSASAYLRGIQRRKKRLRRYPVGLYRLRHLL